MLFRSQGDYQTPLMSLPYALRSFAPNEHPVSAQGYLYPAQDKIAAHKKAGNKVMDFTQGTRQGKPYVAYTVVSKDGMKRRHIYHGSTSKIENIGQTTKPGKDSEE